jgi:hypothetical protein
MSDPTLIGYLKGEHSNRKVFKFISSKMADQGKASHNNWASAYIADDGCRCPIGFLLSKKEIEVIRYELAFLTYSDSKGPETFEKAMTYILPDMLGLFSEYNISVHQTAFLQDLQMAHDTSLLFNKKAPARFMPSFNRYMEVIKKRHV